MFKKLFFLFILLLIFASCTPNDIESSLSPSEDEFSDEFSIDSSAEESVAEESETEIKQDEMVKVDVPILSILYFSLN